MDLVEIHVICLQSLQAFIDLAQDRLARETSAIRIVTHFAMHLGGDDDLIPIREILQRASKNLLALANGINIGRIEEINPQLKRFLDDRPAILLVEHPLVNPTLRIPKPHTTQADARDLHPC